MQGVHVGWVEPGHEQSQQSSLQFENSADMSVECHLLHITRREHLYHWINLLLHWQPRNLQTKKVQRSLISDNIYLFNKCQSS